MHDGKRDGQTRYGRRRIYLMRHGHVDYFTPELAAGGDPRLAQLTDEGQAQAQAARDALLEAPIDFAACSGLPRTQRTAEIVLSPHRDELDLVSDANLEELRSGKFFTSKKSEFAARLRYSIEAAAEPGATFLEGGERFTDAYERITTAFESLILDCDWSCALVVLHEGVNRIILGWACNGGLGAVSTFEQDLGCVNVLDFDITPANDDGRPIIERAIIKAVNVTPYDYLKHGMRRTSLEALFEV